MSPVDDPKHPRLEARPRAALDAAESERSLAEDAADRELADRIRALPLERSPERDLWPGIAARLAPAGAARAARLRLGALAAALVAALVAALLVTDGRSGRPAQSDAPAVAAEPAPSDVERAPSFVPAAYAATGAELDRLRLQLRREVERRSAELPADARASVAENLETIDRAIAAIEAELSLRPDDRSLARTSIAYRQRQLELLRRVNQTAARL